MSGKRSQQASSVSRNGNTATPELVDLTLSDDEEGAPVAVSRAATRGLRSLRKRLAVTPTSGGATAKKIKTEQRARLKADIDNEVEIIDLMDTKQAATPAAAVDDEIEIVDKVDTFQALEPTTTAVADDEIEVVGTKNQVLLPHMRQHCTEKPFSNSSDKGARDAENQSTCECCYCYVCDAKADECQVWQQHCHATDKGSSAFHWRQQRSLAVELKKKGEWDPVKIAEREAQEVLPPNKHFRQNCLVMRYCSLSGRNRGACDNCYCYVCHLPTYLCQQWRYGTLLSQHCHATDTGRDAEHWKSLREQTLAEQGRTANLPPPSPPLEGRGPFPPDHEQAAEQPDFDACRHCGWYSDFSDHADHYIHRQNSIIPEMQWCLACGLVASEKCLDKSQGTQYVPAPGDILLGSKVIPFKLHVHDPRQMTRFKQKWTENPTWKLDKGEMEKDFFRHKIAKTPSLENLICLITPFRQSRIPTDGIMQVANRSSPHRVCARECDAIVMEHKDIMILDNLLEIKSGVHFGSSDGATLFGTDIVASWDDASSEGKLEIRVFLQNWSIERSFASNSSKIGLFLLQWYGGIPCSTADLRGVMKPRPIQASELENLHAAPPADKLAEAIACWEAKNMPPTTAQGEHSKLSLAPTSSGLGGICSSKTSFNAILKTYFRECFADEINATNRCSLEKGSSKPFRGIISGHRKAMGITETGSGAWTRGRDGAMLLESLLGRKRHVLAYLQNAKSALVVHEKVTSLASLLDHTENLGHASAPYVEGLEVELLPFQQQSLQWALERETVSGGVQSFHWIKIPLPANSQDELYFSPILGMFTKTKPALVRGGMICEQMGLGKTVISLALILCNPAPQLPHSGAPASDIAKAPKPANGASFWMHQQSSVDDPKKGSIFSRGTLVVCNVSLVGQWIDEAKSKLRDPGLVYPYHGGCRKRDANLLSKNSIVVTTYETLASDLIYHSKKEGAGYCPPLEQIRWWRVICDESHVMRSSSGKSRAVMRLVADNKWLVSGTPMSMGLKDLTNQFRFLGIREPENIVSNFQEAVGTKINDKSFSGRRRHRGDTCIGKFTFMMRSLMMRHSQQMKYVGTSTTLMSLPALTEEVLTVEFSSADKTEYVKLETQARASYSSIAREMVSRSWMKLTASLLPMRVACSGGRLPLKTNKKETEPAEGNAVDKSQSEAEPSRYAFTSKLERLIEELEVVRDTEPKSKALVFSQYASALQWLQQELPKRGFQFRSLSGDMTMSQRSKALRDFQNDPPTTIFLLSMRAGAVGINLTGANRVFLLEPCFNPSLEQQAIGRVWRLGQTRPVKIFRMIVKDSIEERMRVVLEKKYGASAPAKDEDNDEDEEDGEEDDTKPAAVKPASVLVGNLMTDKAQILAEEFDLLFGVDTGSKPEVVSSAYSVGI